jgi:hypothetical protein
VFAWLAGVCARATPTPSPATHSTSHNRFIHLLDDTEPHPATNRHPERSVTP